MAKGKTDSGGACVLVVNSGSSSLKLAALPVAGRGGAWRAQVEGIGARARATLVDPLGKALSSAPLAARADHAAALEHGLALITGHIPLRQIIATGHRIVHGGTVFSGPALVSARVIRHIEKLSTWAPLHQPHNLAGLRVARALLPKIPHVACFDTAFHQTIPEANYTYAVPLALRARGLRRFGFHGLSFAHIQDILPQHLAPARRRRVIAAHLGNGCSLCALKDGVSVNTTMGVTPLDGLVMGTRSGSLDPSALLHLINRLGMESSAAENLLFRKSGLLGVSGESNDMRALLASKSAPAALAIELFVGSAVRGILAMAASLEGMDALVFTGGIGEKAAPIRAAIINRLAWLGLRLDARANAAHETRISARASKISVLVLTAGEERVIARQTLAVIHG